MAYSKAKLKSSGDKASPCFRPFWIGKLSDKCLPIRTLLYVGRRLVRPQKCASYENEERCLNVTDDETPNFHYNQLAIDDDHYCQLSPSPTLLLLWLIYNRNIPL
jgi:hypothetical protein